MGLVIYGHSWVPTDRNIHDGVCEGNTKEVLEVTHLEGRRRRKAVIPENCHKALFCSTHMVSKEGKVVLVIAPLWLMRYFSSFGHKLRLVASCGYIGCLLGWGFRKRPGQIPLCNAGSFSTSCYDIVKFLPSLISIIALCQPFFLTGKNSTLRIWRAYGHVTCHCLHGMVENCRPMPNEAPLTILQWLPYSASKNFKKAKEEKLVTSEGVQKTEIVGYKRAPQPHSSQIKLSLDI